MPIDIVTENPAELDEIGDPLQQFMNRAVVDFEVVVNQDIAKTGQTASPLMKIRRDDTGALQAVENATGVVRGSQALLGHDVVADIKQALHGNLEVTLCDHPRIGVRQVLGKGMAASCVSRLTLCSRRRRRPAAISRDMTKGPFSQSPERRLVEDLSKRACVDKPHDLASRHKHPATLHA